MFSIKAIEIIGKEQSASPRELQIQISSGGVIRARCRIGIGRLGSFGWLNRDLSGWCNIFGHGELCPVFCILETWFSEYMVS
jgi:hypothetical protein